MPTDCRLGRSLPHLIELIGDLGADFGSLPEYLDTTTAGGRLVLHMRGCAAISGALFRIIGSEMDDGCSEMDHESCSVATFRAT